MVMTVFNVQRMSKSSEVKGGGTTTTVARTRSIDASPEVVPVEEGGGGAVPEGSTLGRLELSLSHMSNPLPKKSGTYGSNYVYVLRSREVI